MVNLDLVTYLRLEAILDSIQTWTTDKESKDLSIVAIKLLHESFNKGENK